jgi:exodeoxyribonuclease VII large subunit
MQQYVARRRHAFAAAGAKLDALSPLKVLERGYSLVRGPDGHLLADAARVAPGDALSVELARGRIDARVERVAPDGDDEQ